MSRLRDPRLLLAGVVILAAAIRVGAIGSRLHVDDAYTWLVASQPSAHAFLRQLAATENTPPLSYLLLVPLPINDPVWLRLPAAVCGMLLSPVAYLAVRRPLGVRVALVSALVIAVAPFLITDSDLARGFMLEDLALLVALWSLLRLGTGTASRRWWVGFVLASVVALYTEYSAAIFLGALVAAVLWRGRPGRRELLIACGVVLLCFAPWIPEIVRAQNQVGLTKLPPPSATLSANAARDAVVVLALGENGGTTSGAGRWLEVLVMAGVAVAAGAVLRRSWRERSPEARDALAVIALAAAGTYVGHALAAVAGIDIFSFRYMTILVPLVAILGAAAVEMVGRRCLVAGAIVLVVLGAVEIVRRAGGQYEPDFAPVRAVALATHPRTVLTNTPTVQFYLRSLHPVFDRPSNLGPGDQASCARPCLIIDDVRAHGGTPRRLSVPPLRVIGPYVLSLEP